MTTGWDQPPFRPLFLEQQWRIHGANASFLNGPERIRVRQGADASVPLGDRSSMQSFRPFSRRDSQIAAGRKRRFLRSSCAGSAHAAPILGASRRRAEIFGSLRSVASISWRSLSSWRSDGEGRETAGRSISSRDSSLPIGNACTTDITRRRYILSVSRQSGQLSPSQTCGIV